MSEEEIFDNKKKEKKKKRRKIRRNKKVKNALRSIIMEGPGWGLMRNPARGQCDLPAEPARS